MVATNPLARLDAKHLAARTTAASALRRSAAALSGRLGFVTLVVGLVFAPSVLATIAVLVCPGDARVELAMFVVVAANALVGAPATAAALAEHTIFSLGGDRAPLGVALRHALGAALRTLPLALAVASMEAMGYALFVVPGIVVAVLFALAIPIQVVERVSLGTALSRSVKLTVGGRWALFIALGTAGALGALGARFAAVVFGPAGLGFGFALQAALLGAAATAIYSDRRLALEGVEIDTLVKQLGGTPGGASRVLADDVERALARADAMPGLAPEAAPRSVQDHELLDGARHRDRRMAFVMRAALVVIPLGFVAIGVLAIQSRAAAKRESESAAAELNAELAQAHGASSVVARAIVSRRDLYGKDLVSLVTALQEQNEKERSMTVLSLLEDELTALGCQEAIAPSKRSGGGYDFAAGCAASPLVPDDAHRVGAPELAAATVLEARATKAGKGEDPMHKSIMKALLRP